MHLKNKILAKLLVVLLLLLFTTTLGREIYKFNEDWKFSKGNILDAYLVEFNDSEWENVRIPHDWAIKGPFDPNGDPETGKLPWRGEGWYRKTFYVAGSLKEKKIIFMFDGVMAFPKIYINGELAYEWDYGYNSFHFDATDFIEFGEENIIAVHVDTRNHESRWYPGAGIYRKVQMIIVDQVYTDIWGTYITTPKADKQNVDVRVFTNVINSTNEEQAVVLNSNVIDPNGTIILSESDTLKFEGNYEFEQWFRFKNPRLWDVVDPNLYNLESKIVVDGKITDEVVTKFGIRSIELTANDGFQLNGRRVQLRGVNLHHDNGPLGAVFSKRAMERKLKIMKEMGCNAIRTSHNIPAPELLELCDEMGLLVIDEAFDKWDKKGRFATRFGL